MHGSTCSFGLRLLLRAGGPAAAAEPAESAERAAPAPAAPGAQPCMAQAGSRPEGHESADEEDAKASCHAELERADGEAAQPALSNKQRKLAAKREKQKAKAGPAAPVLACKVCSSRFDSRNKLFKHIADTGHAQLK